MEFVYYQADVFRTELWVIPEALPVIFFPAPAAPTGRIMSSLVSDGGLIGSGGLAGSGGGLAG